MDKGKSKADGWTSTESDNVDSENERVLNLLRKQKWEFEDIIDEIRRGKDYWKDAYMQEHLKYQKYSRWTRDEMEMMTSRHRSQHHNVKNIAAQNRIGLNHIKGDLVSKVDEAFRQAMDSMNSLEWLARDHMKEEVVPRYQEPWVPSMLGERSVRDTMSHSPNPRSPTPPPRAPTPPPTIGLGAGPSTILPGAPRRVRLTARKRVRLPPPLPPRVDDDEAAAMWVDRMLDDMGDGAFPGGDNRRLERDGDDDGSESVPDEESEEDRD